MSIEEICKKYYIKNYTINVDGDVELSSMGFTEIPIRFNHVSGCFNFYNNELTSLEGSPKSVGGNFDCNGNKIYSLEEFNSEIGNIFYCYDNPIEYLINNGVDSDFIKAFNTFKVVKDKVVNLKRLKYVMSMFDEPVYLDLIKKHYTIV